MPTTVVFKTGEPPLEIESARGTFFDWIRSAAGSTSLTEEWIEVDARDESAVRAVRGASCVVITGSPASVTERASWMLALEHKIVELEATRTPMLGICFGHQIIAQALGGHVVRNPRGREMGTLHVNVCEADPLFEGFSPSAPFHMTHIDTVERLPPKARLLATSPLDHHAAYAIGDHVRAVQFHPEFDHDILERYIAARSEKIRGEGLCPDAIRSTVAPSDHGRALLDNFFRAFVRRILPTAA